MASLDLADVKPSLFSLFMITLMAIVGISLAKVALNKWKVPGLTDIVNMV